MAREVAFLGRASSRARRASVVNTALSYASVNSLAGDATEVPLATPKTGRLMNHLPSDEFLKQSLGQRHGSALNRALWQCLLELLHAFVGGQRVLDVQIL